MLGSSPALKGKKLLIFDDGLASKDGHWFEYDKAIAMGHHQLGIDVTVASHKDFQFGNEFAEVGALVRPEITASTWNGWVPARGTYAGMAAKSKLLAPLIEWNGILQQARHHAEVLEKLLAEQVYDCVLHPTALAADFMAWSYVPARLRARAGRIVLSTWLPLGTYSSSGSPTFARKLAYWKWIARRLGSEFASGRMVLLVDSKRLAGEYLKIAGLESELVSSPRSVTQFVPDGPPRQTSLVFGSLGAARWEKGIDLFESAIEAVLVEGEARDLRFVIQRNRVVTGPDERPLPLPPWLIESARVTYLKDILTSQDYNRSLADIDCMVLPYRRQMYHSRSSAVAIEAACAGIPMIYTDDTWLSDFVAEQGAGIAIADDDSAALARAIREMADQFPAFKAKAVERAAIARERNSPQRYVRTVWGLTQ